MILAESGDGIMIWGRMTFQKVHDLPAGALKFPCLVDSTGAAIQYDLILSRSYRYSLWLVAPKKISQDFQKNPLVTRLFRTFLYSFLPSSFAIGGISCLFNCVQKKIPVRIDVFPIFKTRVAGFKSGNLFTKIIDFLEIILSIRYNNV